MTLSRVGRQLCWRESVSATKIVGQRPPPVLHCAIDCSSKLQSARAFLLTLNRLHWGPQTGDHLLIAAQIVGQPHAHYSGLI